MKPFFIATMIAGAVFATALLAQTPARRTPTALPSRLAVSANLQADIRVLLEAQENALEMVNDLRAKAEDPRSQVAIASAVKEMEKAIEILKAAKDSPTTLEPALAAEQLAYQALLRLAAHEYQVSKNRNQKKGGSRSGEQHFQEMLDQLDLKKAEDRYEKQEKASPLQTEEQREQLATLNRLKELAQRQQDIHEKFQEAQTARQQAKTEQEKEELRRQLKRLQEDERQMLADVDELRQKMEQGETQSRMADERRQLEQSRQQAQKAAEAMDREAASEALAAGTRAQRDLQQLRDEFRKKTSRPFSDETGQMRNDARELAQNQEELGRRMESLNTSENKRRSLSDTDERTQVGDQLHKQESSLTDRKSTRLNSSH